VIDVKLTDRAKLKPRNLPALGTRIFLHENALLFIILFVLIILFAVLSNGSTVSRENISNIVVQSAIRGVAGAGQALIMLTSGIDLSPAGVATVTSMIGASLLTNIPEKNIFSFPLPLYVVLPLMLVLGTAIGLANGLLVWWLRVPALIATMGVWQIANGIAYSFGGGQAIVGLPESISFISHGDLASVPVPIVLLFFVITVFYFILNHTPLGKEIYAVGGNAQSAYLSGVRIQMVGIAMFTVAGFLYSVGGILGTSRFMSGSTIQLQGLELDTIAAVVIGGVRLGGGKGSIIGVLLGVLIIGVINNGLNVLGIHPALTAVTKGLIIITAVGIDYSRRQ
jgi:ribose/xylose/arabinose/galactoside ABC-type transport system permease subunit